LDKRKVINNTKINNSEHKMNTKEFIIKLEQYKIITRKPKQIYVFLLFFAYFLIWVVAFILYIKFDMTALRFWVIAIGVLTFLTLVHAFIHRYVVKVLSNVKEEENEEDTE